MDEFDPYHKWLGIPPREQPPNLYRLLGVPNFVADSEVIQNAADQRMAHLRTYSAGQNVKEAQRLLNEVSAARICLRDPEKRSAYDAQLRAELGELSTDNAVVSVPESPQPPPVAVAPAPRRADPHELDIPFAAGADQAETPAPVVLRRPPRRKKKTPMLVALATLAALLVIVTLVAFALLDGKSSDNGLIAIGGTPNLDDNAVADPVQHADPSADDGQPTTESDIATSGLVDESEPEPTPESSLAASPGERPFALEEAYNALDDGDIKQMIGLLNGFLASDPAPPWSTEAAALLADATTATDDEEALGVLRVALADIPDAAIRFAIESRKYPLPPVEVPIVNKRLQKVFAERLNHNRERAYRERFRTIGRSGAVAKSAATPSVATDPGANQASSGSQEPGELPSGANEADELFSKAQAALKEKQIKSVIDYLEQYLDVGTGQPKAVEAQQLLNDARRSISDELAMETWRKFLANRPDNEIRDVLSGKKPPKVHYNVGFAFSELREVFWETVNRNALRAYHERLTTGGRATAAAEPGEEPPADVELSKDPAKLLAFKGLKKDGGYWLLREEITLSEVSGFFRELDAKHNIARKKTLTRAQKKQLTRLQADYNAKKKKYDQVVQAAWADGVLTIPGEAGKVENAKRAFEEVADGISKLESQSNQSNQEVAAARDELVAALNEARQLLQTAEIKYLALAGDKRVQEACEKLGGSLGPSANFARMKRDIFKLYAKLGENPTAGSGEESNIGASKAKPNIDHAALLGSLGLTKAGNKWVLAEEVSLDQSLRMLRKRQNAFNKARKKIAGPSDLKRLQSMKTQHAARTEKYEAADKRFKELRFTQKKDADALRQERKDLDELAKRIRNTEKDTKNAKESLAAARSELKAGLHEAQVLLRRVEANFGRLEKDEKVLRACEQLGTELGHSNNLNSVKKVVRNIENQLASQ